MFSGVSLLHIIRTRIAPNSHVETNASARYSRAEGETRMPFFPCPHCTSQVKVTDPSIIGQTLPCPACSVPIVVRCDRPTRKLWGEKPDESLSRLKAVVAELKAADAINERQRRRRFGTAIGAALAVVVFIFVCIANRKADTPSQHTFNPQSYNGTSPQAVHLAPDPNPYIPPESHRERFKGTAKEDEQVLKIMEDLKNNDQARARRDATHFKGWKKDQ